MTQDQHKPIHIIHIIANENTAPYLNWFAEWAVNDNRVKFSFINLFPTKPQMIEDVKLFNCECFWIPYNSANKRKELLRVLFQLYKLIKKLRPDAVNSHLFEDSLLTLGVAKLLGVKKRLVTKGDTAFHYFHTPKMMKFDKLVNRWATHIIAPSSEAMEFIINKEKANKKKVYLIHHGINFSEMSSSSEDHKIELMNKFDLHNKKIIGTVCRYIKWKGYLQLIAAIELVVKKYPKLVFLFVGEGPQRSELEKIIKEKELGNNIILTGWIQKELIPSLFSIFDLYVHPAHYEPFGFVIPEAALNKIPIVSTPTGSAKDLVVHLESGFIAPYYDIEKMAEGIIFMLENNTELFVKKAYEDTIQKYSFDKMYEEYCQLYL